MSKKNKRLRNQNRIRGKFEHMIEECPICKSRSYPRVLSNPQNEDEAKALFCGSCKTNLRPFIEYNQMEEQKRLAQEAMAENKATEGLVGPSPQVMASAVEESV